MAYDEETHLRLLEEVEAQGGEALLWPCAPHKFRIKQPMPGKSNELRWEEHFTAGCGGETMVAIPVEGGAPAAVCMYDDMVHLWPRFSEALRDD